MTVRREFLRHWLISGFFLLFFSYFSPHIFSPFPPLWASILLRSVWCWNEDILSSTSNALLSKQAAVGSVFHLALWEPIMPPPARAVGQRIEKRERENERWEKRAWEGLPQPFSDYPTKKYEAPDCTEAACWETGSEKVALLKLGSQRVDSAEARIVDMEDCLIWKWALRGARNEDEALQLGCRNASSSGARKRSNRSVSYSWLATACLEFHTPSNPRHSQSQRWSKKEKKKVHQGPFQNYEHVQKTFIYNIFRLHFCLLNIFYWYI